eukprot:116979-Prorocentrum_minimum.AAC.3
MPWYLRARFPSSSSFRLSTCAFRSASRAAASSSRRAVASKCDFKEPSAASDAAAARARSAAAASRVSASAAASFAIGSVAISTPSVELRTREPQNMRLCDRDYGVAHYSIGEGSASDSA